MRDPEPTDVWKVSGWFNLHADAIGGHKRGESRRAEHVRPIGRVLLRLMLQGSPNAKRDAKTMSPAEVAALENEALAAASEDEVEGDGEEEDVEKAAGANSEKRADALRRKAEARAMRLAAEEPPLDILPLPTAQYMLQVQVYQAKDLPAADAQGSSDPFAVVRCGRAQAKTQVCHATTSPGWFKEMLMQVELPLHPIARKKPKRDGGESGSDSGSESGSDSNASGSPGDMSLGQAAARGVRPGGVGVGAGAIAGFDGVAWWAAPALSVVVLDEGTALVLSQIQAHCLPIQD